MPTQTATATATLVGQNVLVTITEDGEVTETFSVKDGSRFISKIDRKLSDLMWNRSGFGPGMTATLTRPALYNLLVKIA